MPGRSGRGLRGLGAQLGISPGHLRGPRIMQRAHVVLDLAALDIGGPQTSGWCCRPAAGSRSEICTRVNSEIQSLVKCTCSTIITLVHSKMVVLDLHVALGLVSLCSGSEIFSGQTHTAVHQSIGNFTVVFC